MKDSLIKLLFIIVWSQTDCKSTDLITDQTKAVKYLYDVNKELALQMRITQEAGWAYLTNMNNQTSAAQLEADKEFNNFQKMQALATKRYNWIEFDEPIRRQFEKLAVIGTSALNKKDEDMFGRVTNDMHTTYSSAKVCMSTKGCNLSLDPELSEIMSSSKNYSELSEAWKVWRDAVGKPIRQKYITYFTLGNKAAKMNSLPNKKFKTLDDLWMHDWETNDLKEQTERLWKKLKPFYQKLHTYVKLKLYKQYPQSIRWDGTIPAHITGGMGAQYWGSLMKTVKGIDPYPDLEPIDVTNSLKEQGYTAKRIFEMSEKFFTDLGLDKMTKTFWEKSIIEKPKDRTIDCHAQAIDFMGDDDFRIKQCTKINMVSMITVHHEMGHIQYYIQYKNQPTVYRAGANPGFHEAIGDLLALSVATPKHLKKIGLLKNTERTDLNKMNLKFQMNMALDKIMYLPSAYVIDRWRWDVFSGKVATKDMNRHWWKLTGEYQGVSPPVMRSEDDFDPGAKYHIAANVEYIRYFVSHILQFQFHKKLCSFSQKDVPLHECDIDGDKEAGKALKEMLMKGASEPWPQQLKALTGTKDMDVQPLLDYFKPLDKFLTKELERFKWLIGWNFNADKLFIIVFLIIPCCLAQWIPLSDRLEHLSRGILRDFEDHPIIRSVRRPHNGHNEKILKTFLKLHIESMPFFLKLFKRAAEKTIIPEERWFVNLAASQLSFSSKRLVKEFIYFFGRHPSEVRVKHPSELMSEQMGVFEEILFQRDNFEFLIAMYAINQCFSTFLQNCHRDWEFRFPALDEFGSGQVTDAYKVQIDSNPNAVAMDRLYSRIIKNTYLRVLELELRWYDHIYENI